MTFARFYCRTLGNAALLWAITFSALAALGAMR